MINWDMPIEWSDGTPAWLAPDGVARYVRSEEPNMWGRHLPTISPIQGVMANEDGSFRSGWTGPSLRNADISMVSFDDGTHPFSGTFENAGRSVALKHQSGLEYVLTWPLLKQTAVRKGSGVSPPSPNWPNVVVVSNRELRKKKEEEAQAAVLQENPLYGSF